MGHVLKPWASEMAAAMRWLADKEDTLFLGQGVGIPGTSQSKSLEGIPTEKRLEMPVAENLQMGIAIGLSLAGKVPICLYPRWQFLFLAMDQLVNHLDKIPLYSSYKPKVIIRVAEGSDCPLDPGHQHKGDFSAAFQSMLRAINVVKLNHEDGILNAYRDAYYSHCSTLIVEDARLC